MKNNQKITSDLIDLFQKTRKEQGLSLEKLANLINIDSDKLDLIENKQETLTALTCLKIATALGISPKKLTDMIAN